MSVMKKLHEFTDLMKSPIIGGSVEKRHEIKSPAWSGKTTEGLAT
jgi:hypothetical protein